MIVLTDDHLTIMPKPGSGRLIIQDHIIKYVLTNYLKSIKYTLTDHLRSLIKYVLSDFWRSFNYYVLNDYSRSYYELCFGISRSIIKNVKYVNLQVSYCQK